MIEIHITHHTDGAETASCEWGSRTFSARSQNGAHHALCRELVAAGCPDEPWTLPGRMTGRVHSSAVLTIGDANGPPRCVPWAPHPRAQVCDTLAQLVAEARAKRAHHRQK